MKYDVSGILKNDGSKLDIDVCKSDEELGLVLGDIEVDDKICCKGKITNISKVLNVNIDVVINYHSRCGRCLAKVDGKEEVHIDVDIANINDTNDKDGYFYSSGSLDLGIIVNDSIWEALPVKHLCSHNCKGLCCKCGQDLNLYDCNCVHEVIDERFSALKKYSD